MARYRNPKTGVVVNIPAELAAQLGSYEPVEQPVVEDEKPPQRRKTTKK